MLCTSRDGGRATGGDRDDGKIEVDDETRARLRAARAEAAAADDDDAEEEMDEDGPMVVSATAFCHLAGNKSANARHTIVFADDDETSLAMADAETRPNASSGVASDTPLNGTAERRALESAARWFAAQLALPASSVEYYQERRLRSLTLRGNGEMAEGALCDATGACTLPPSLTHLDLAHNRMADLRGLLGAVGRRCPALRTLSLCGNPLDGERWDPTRSLLCTYA